MPIRRPTSSTAYKPASFLAVPALRFCCICANPVSYHKKRGHTTNPTCGIRCWEEKRRQDALKAEAEWAAREVPCKRCGSIYLQADRGQSPYCTVKCSKEASAESSSETVNRMLVMRGLAEARASLPTEVISHGKSPKRVAR